MTRQFGAYTFRHVAVIEPDRDSTGQVIVHHPHAQHQHGGQLALNRYGDGPFCHFRIPPTLWLEGVYLITVENAVRYVGECENLARRFNLGYGQISPRNCYVAGQSTNCKVNRLVLQAVASDQRVDLWFVETSDRKRIEAELVAQLQPPWNGRYALLPPAVNQLVRDQPPANAGRTPVTRQSRPPVREMLQEAIRALDGDATVAALTGWILDQYPGTDPSTIRSQVTFCTVNSPARVHVAHNSKPRIANDSRYDFLFQPERGVSRVVLYDPARHGVWAITQGADQRLQVTRVDAGEDSSGASPPPASARASAMQRSSSHVGPPRSTLSAAPGDARDFGFMQDEALRRVVALDYREAERVFEARAFKATAVLLGGVLEGMLQDAMRQSAVTGHPEYQRAVQRFNRGADGQIAWDRVTLSQLIQAAGVVGLLDHRAQQMAQGARDWRNAVHPALEAREGRRPDREDADLLLALVRLIYRELAQ